jgi:hypothetical protein
MKKKDLVLENQKLKEAVEEIKKDFEQTKTKKLMVITCKKDFEDEVTLKVQKGLQNLGLADVYDVMVLPDVVTSVNVP